LNDVKRQDSQRFVDMGFSYLKRANNKLDEAGKYINDSLYALSISASQECLEFSIKAIFYHFGIEPQKDHWFNEKGVIPLIKKVPQNLEYLNFPRLLMISQLWGNLYILAKYGQEKLGIGSEKIFQKKEAELAYSHAEECRNAATAIQVNIGRSF
jgi:HEPN domain-containing protein